MKTKLMKCYTVRYGKISIPKCYLSDFPKTRTSPLKSLEIIAPGQNETLREACLEKTELISDGDTLKYLQAAVTQIHISNDRVQLVSVPCAKDNDSKYIYSIAELLKLFADMSKHLNEKARINAAGRQAGMPIEAEKYVKKRLIDDR